MGNMIVEALNVRVVGSGDRNLVLAHGFGTDQSVWQRILPYFTPGYRVILYDLVCAGSVNPDHFDFRRYTTLDAFVDDLLAILDALSVDRCFYVGHSVYAMIFSPKKFQPVWNKIWTFLLFFVLVFDTNWNDLFNR